MTDTNGDDGGQPATPGLGNGLAGILSAATDPPVAALTASDADVAPPAEAVPAEPVLDHPLSAAYEDGRRPWVWGNLNRDEVGVQEAILDVWVVAYNDELVADQSALIPACWRQHPPLLHELPVLYWAWWFSHLDKQTEISGATDFYSETLPGFQRRLGELVGTGAANCRKGRHSDGLTEEFVDYRDAIADRLNRNISDSEFSTRALTAFPMASVKGATA